MDLMRRFVSVIDDAWGIVFLPNKIYCSYTARSIIGF